MSQQPHCGPDLHEFAFFTTSSLLKYVLVCTIWSFSSVLYQALNSHSPTENGRFQFTSNYGRLWH